MLNERQRAFALSYVKSPNATEAAKSAGYSAKTAHQIGHQLLKHPSVAAEIARLTCRIEKKSELTAERVMQELSNIAFFDPASMYDEHGKLLKVKDMPEATRRAIAGIEEDLIKGTKLKLSSKLGGLELAAKILQMVKQEQTNQQAVQIVIAQAPVSPEKPLVTANLLPQWE